MTLLELIGAKWDLDIACRMNGHVDMGPSEAMFPEPLKVVTPAGGNDPAFAGFPVVEIANDQDMDQYRSTQRVVNNTDAADSTDVTSTQFQLPDPFGRPTDLSTYEESTEIPSAMLLARQAKELNEANSHRTVAITTDQIADLLEPGQYVYVYDPSQGLTRANSTAINLAESIPDSIEYRGRMITPIKLRCISRTDPNRRGEGFYFGTWDGRYSTDGGKRTWLDLTDHVQQDSDLNVKVEVDIFRRALLGTPPRKVQDDLTIMVENPYTDSRRY